MTTYPPEEFTRSPQPRPPQPEAEQEIDLSALWSGIRRQGLWILLSTALVGLVTYMWSRAQPNVYEASSSLVTSGGSLGGNLRDNVIVASPLPMGALQEALQGPVIMGEIIRRVRADSSLSPAIQLKLTADLQKELQKRDVRTLQLQARLDPGGNGIYTATAKAPTPDAATRVADIMVQALLNWDRGRALSGVQRAEKSLRSQMAEVDRQLTQPALASLDRLTLLSSRALLQRSLAQAGIQAEGATGFLELVAPAVTPLEPVAPKPLRNGVLAALLTLLLGSGVAALRTVLDRTARSEDDLLVFGLPTLGTIPRLRNRDVVFSGIVRAARGAGLYEAIGFLRVNLLSRIGIHKGQRIMISSTVPGEGKSSLTATLADGLATGGQRVLIIDADMRRGTQQDVWDKYDREHEWIQLVGSGGARTLQDALANPANVQVLQAEPGVDVLPAGPGTHDSLGLLNRAQLGEYLSAWGQGYDVVLIDSPPLLALADGLVIGRHTDYTLLVVEEGKTSLQAIRRSLRRAESSDVKVLGFILNKVTQNSEEGRAYNYSSRYAPKGSS